VDLNKKEISKNIMWQDLKVKKTMTNSPKIYVAGYRVMVDSEILRKHNSRGHKNILTERMLKLILQAR
jgi:hypothetical protein